ncbi:sigma-24 (FecI-like) [Rhodoferax ferrireducens T118]|uniref:Sigma-24 (FecI-like) n=1 Tax=Albidiferax ferrireducens (strain ATCC BAA-621 / DSM 15236 / T118) TaxID=338969 RepID=Q21QX1_ALBFT|nr:RNA polymerase sigma factor [Rhodoferax ferrireducens]ABD71832.1 sigma-24 (FecI-like) [Rhodoferax ferrireducens T118]
MNTQKTMLPAPLDVSSDAELVDLAIAGHDAAFSQIMRRHNRLLFRTARGILKNDDDTQDALQEAYLRAWRALASFRSDARLSTWLVRIVVNEALGRLRRSGVQPAQVLPLNAAIDPDGETPEMQMQANPDDQPEPTAVRAQIRQQIEARIDSLPDSFRSVFMLRGVEELSVEETALALDIPEATVRSRFFRARGILREGLSRDIDMAIGDAFSFAGPRCDRIVEGVLARIAHERESSRS